MIREIYRRFDMLQDDEIADIDSAEYVNAMTQAELLKDELCQRLPPEFLKDFKNYIEQQDIIATSAREDGFVQGFRIASRLVLDI